MTNTPEHETFAAGVADAARVIGWANSSPRKLAVSAFTAGPERQAAYWIEWAERRFRQRLSERLVPFYFRDRAFVAEICDLVLDRSGALLGDLRNKAGAACGNTGLETVGSEGLNSALLTDEPKP